MAKLSIILPSRDEKFLIPTIHDIFAHAKGEIEVVAVLDSDKWPPDWKIITDQYPNLHTIHHGKSLGMRRAINSGVASAISRGAKWIIKSDAHCMFDEGFDVKLLETIEPNWIVIPRRKRLDADNWTLTDTQKPDVDYHYLSFPDDPKDFGGPGLNGKIWVDRAIQRKDVMIDDEMSSQGSCWLTSATYFQQLELMDEASYGPFWNEMQEIALKAWLSGGQVKVNKNTWYAHLHKGKTHGRGYKLDEKWLTQGRNHTMLWPWNEAWGLQTKPFSWLIEHFWPVPTWPENWEEVLYAERRPKSVLGGIDNNDRVVANDSSGNVHPVDGGLQVIQAHYGVGGLEDIDVRERLQNIAYLNNDSLDIIVNNSTLTPGENPFRGKKKQLNVTYSLDGSETVTRTVAEKDWLIIGPATPVREFTPLAEHPKVTIDEQGARYNAAPLTAPALNDYLIRKFQISDRRLRGPMPIELRDFHRNDLAQLFAELEFKKGAEIGVAEGHYSEILLKANPDLELLLVDPWRRYDGNPYAHSQEHQDFSFNETKRKTAPYPNVRIMQDFSMNAVREVEENSLDFVYIDGHHGFDWVMQDLIEWGKRVRSGGVISGDDYYHFKRSWAGVVEAVNAYTLGHRISPWFLIDAPRSVDFFFVRP